MSSFSSPSSAFTGPSPTELVYERLGQYGMFQSPSAAKLALEKHRSFSDSLNVPNRVNFPPNLSYNLQLGVEPSPHRPSPSSQYTPMRSSNSPSTPSLPASSVPPTPFQGKSAIPLANRLPPPSASSAASVASTPLYHHQPGSVQRRNWNHVRGNLFDFSPATLARARPVDITEESIHPSTQSSPAAPMIRGVEKGIQTSAATATDVARSLQDQSFQSSDDGRSIREAQAVLSPYKAPYHFTPPRSAAIPMTPSRLHTPATSSALAGGGGDGPFSAGPTAYNFPTNAALLSATPSNHPPRSFSPGRSGGVESSPLPELGSCFLSPIQAVPPYIPSLPRPSALSAQQPPLTNNLYHPFSGDLSASLLPPSLVPASVPSNINRDVPNPLVLSANLPPSPASGGALETSALSYSSALPNMFSVNTSTHSNRPPGLSEPVFPGWVPISSATAGASANVSVGSLLNISGRSSANNANGRTSAVSVADGSNNNTNSNTSGGSGGSAAKKLFLDAEVDGRGGEGGGRRSPNLSTQSGNTVIHQPITAATSTNTDADIDAAKQEPDASALMATPSTAPIEASATGPAVPPESTHVSISNIQHQIHNASSSNESSQAGSGFFAFSSSVPVTVDPPPLLSPPSEPQSTASQVLPRSNDPDHHDDVSSVDAYPQAKASVTVATSTTPSLLLDTEAASSSTSPQPVPQAVPVPVTAAALNDDATRTSATIAPSFPCMLPSPVSPDLMAMLFTQFCQLVNLFWTILVASGLRSQVQGFGASADVSEQIRTLTTVLSGFGPSGLQQSNLGEGVAAATTNTPAPEKSAAAPSTISPHNNVNNTMWNHTGVNLPFPLPSQPLSALLTSPPPPPPPPPASLPVPQPQPRPQPTATTTTHSADSSSSSSSCGVSSSSPSHPSHHHRYGQQPSVSAASSSRPHFRSTSAPHSQHSNSASVDVAVQCQPSDCLSPASDSSSSTPDRGVGRSRSRVRLESMCRRPLRLGAGASSNAATAEHWVASFLDRKRTTSPRHSSSSMSLHHSKARSSSSHSRFASQLHLSSSSPAHTLAALIITHHQRSILSTQRELDKLGQTTKPYSHCNYQILRSTILSGIHPSII